MSLKQQHLRPRPQNLEAKPRPEELEAEAKANKYGREGSIHATEITLKVNPFSTWRLHVA